MNRKFLMDLLDTSSPSGLEKEIQLLWLDYMKKFSHKTESDNVGNAYAILNPEADFKIMIAAHGDEIGFMVKRIDSNGFIFLEKLGGISPKIAIGMKIKFLGNKKIVGVVGANAEHHGGVKEELTIDDIYVDCGFKDKESALKFLNIGDMAVYKRETEILQENRIAGKALDNKTGSFIIAEVMRNLAKENLNIGVYAVNTSTEETNQGGAYFAGSKINPSMAIICDVTFATDYPGVDSNANGEFSLEGGPVLAKGAPINLKINTELEKSAKELDIKLQYELTPRRTGTDADTIKYTGKGVPVALVSLPIRYMHSPVETASFYDIEDEINLLTHFILNLESKINLNPIEG